MTSRASLHRAKRDTARPKALHLGECSWSPAEQSNLCAKAEFTAAIVAAGLSDYSVRDLALFFGVKRSKLFERMSPRRKDLAPLPEWFAKLERHTEWRRLNAEFARQA